MNLNAERPDRLVSLRGAEDCTCRKVRGAGQRLTQEYRA